MRRRIAGCLALVLLLAACASAPPLLSAREGQGYAVDWQRLSGTAGPGGSAQITATMRSWLGEHEAAIAEFDAAQPPRRPSLVPDLSRDRAEDAVSAILRETASRQIVILNEAHHVPLHRAFGMRLARELRKQGFEYLAAEAFSPQTDPNQGAVDSRSGLYLRDPVFAEFIREARREGWQLIAYEALPSDQPASPGERIRRREREQAQNLVARIFDKNPGARVFIHVGYGHGVKTPAPVGQGQAALWMAGELKRMTGIDPLSIDQAFTHAHPDPARELPGYRAALAQASGVSPFVLTKPDGDYRLLAQQPGSVDMQVIHPPQPLVHGRSGWLVTLAERRPFPVPAAWLPAQGRRLIYARHETDPPQAIPADVVLVEAGQPAPALMLPAGGAFRFEFEHF